MANVAVVGSQWGDEGKGKIVDWLSERADVVVRFQGGHNAGHTLVVGDEVYKLSMMPSGVVRPGKTSVIGNGVVVDPWAFLEEWARLEAQGVNFGPDSLVIADNAALILPVHRRIDHARETLAGAQKIGTTGRGIGPAYEDKVARRAVKVCDLGDEALLREKVTTLLKHHNIFLKAAGEAEENADETVASLLEVAPRLLPWVHQVWRTLDRHVRDGKRILFEGAQGAMLDVDHGTYPFVTSSNTVAGQAATGSGVGPTAVGFVLGITKAYTTRVGSGPFPTELTDDVGKQLGERGHEFGTVTGRSRRCGWFDSVMVRQACKVGGITGIAFTKLDVLDGFEEIKICVGYDLGGARLDYFPTGASAQAAVRPIYQTLPGWQESTRGARSWADLPGNAIKYIRYVEELIEVPVAMLSTSPERDDTILVRDPFQG